MTTTVPQPSHLRTLDGLRATAALLVVGTHVGFWTGLVSPSLTGALVARLDVGVALFFGLSGFLLARPWIAVALGGTSRRPDLRTYAVRRIARIAPAYWVALVAVLLLEIGRVFRVELRSTDALVAGNVVPHLVVMQDLIGDHLSSFSQTWSLTTEVTFYAALPGLGWLLCRRASRAGSADERYAVVVRACLAGVVVGAAVSAYAATDLPLATGALGTSLLGHAGWFAAGAWVCAVRLTGRRPRLLAALGPDELVVVAAMCFVLAASPAGGRLLFATPEPWQAAVRELLYAGVAALLLLAATSTGGRPGATSWVLNHPVMVWVGDRSYGLFLWHLPVLFVVLTVLGGPLFEPSPWLTGALTLTISLAIADASFRWIEQPALRWAHRRTQVARQ
jgi:peptidoglycan/LPS O-acetylase OafA/YrhL